MGEPAEAVPAWEYASDVHVGFVGLDGVRWDGPLARYWGEPFELASPARKFITFKGQKNFTGDYWAVTSRDLVGYESWVERDAAMALDFDPAVVALASQPFRLAWVDGDRDRDHTPDYLGQPFRANLRWLARYRHPRCHRASLAALLREVFVEPQLLFAGADRVGDRMAVLPVLYHLLWRHELTADLVSGPLGGGTVVSLAAWGRS
ncbi:TnsA-like heteromeric transposase endonuclease subunit [Streptomyces sp. NPDC050997]|uniref:TnsA-like heteromeric transposase endonuclease subunit n=1 Tax=Streptomyces sp. NPDC050997 TaxID=3155519 RepID=UPI0034354A56